MSSTNKKVGAQRATAGWRGAGLILPVAMLVLAAAVVGALLLSNGRQPGSAQGPGQTASSSRQLAPDFSVTTLDGSTFSLSGHRGKAVVLMFTAPWCYSCIPEIAKLNQLYDKYHGQGLEVLVLDVKSDDGRGDLLRFKQQANGGDYGWAVDRDYKVTTAYGVQVADTKVIIDRQGRVVARFEGGTSPGELEAAVQEALR